MARGRRREVAGRKKLEDAPAHDDLSVDLQPNFWRGCEVRSGLLSLKDAGVSILHALAAAHFVRRTCPLRKCGRKEHAGQSSR